MELSSLRQSVDEAKRILRKWLNRRSQRFSYTWFGDYNQVEVELPGLRRVGLMRCKLGELIAEARSVRVVSGVVIHLLSEVLDVHLQVVGLLSRHSTNP